MGGHEKPPALSRMCDHFCLAFIVAPTGIRFLYYISRDFPGLFQDRPLLPTYLQTATKSIKCLFFTFNHGKRSDYNLENPFSGLVDWRDWSLFLFGLLHSVSFRFLGSKSHLADLEEIGQKYLNSSNPFSAWPPSSPSPFEFVISIQLSKPLYCEIIRAFISNHTTAPSQPVPGSRAVTLPPAFNCTAI